MVIIIIINIIVYTRVAHEYQCTPNLRPLVKTNFAFFVPTPIHFADSWLWTVCTGTGTGTCWCWYWYRHWNCCVVMGLFLVLAIIGGGRGGGSACEGVIVVRTWLVGARSSNVFFGGPGGTRHGEIRLFKPSWSGQHRLVWPTLREQLFCATFGRNRFVKHYRLGVTDLLRITVWA